MVKTVPQPPFRFSGMPAGAYGSERWTISEQDIKTLTPFVPLTLLVLTGISFSVFAITCIWVL
ncbi:MAG: hypothetical protein ILA06_06700 [Bacteroidaceae bacterium]|nr:hypothetical protein [Bacteroidaceae bacterium]